MVYPTTVGALVMGIVPIDSNCRLPGEIFVDACLMARSSDNGIVGEDGMTLSMGVVRGRWSAGEGWRKTSGA